MPEVEEVVDAGEVFRAAAAAARKAFEAGPPVEETATSPEPGSSPEIGAESVVPPEAAVAEGDAKTQQPEEKPEGVVIDPEAAWSEYADDEARKKALAHSKVYGAEMSRKARETEARALELEAKLAAMEKPKEEPEIQAEPKDLPYEDWVKNALEKAETEGQVKVAALAAEYNQLVAEKITPAEAALDKASTTAREAQSLLREREVALKFLQGRKDQALYEDDIREAKELVLEAKLTLTEAKSAEIEAKAEFRDLESERRTALGLLRQNARSTHDAEIAYRRDSASEKKAKAEDSRRQVEVDAAWEQAKLDVIKSRGVTDEAMQQVLKDAADGAIVRAAHQGKSIELGEYGKFINEALKPFAVTAEKAREEVVKKAIAIADEPTPAKATSSKPNLDVQPIKYDEWRLRARKMMESGV